MLSITLDADGVLYPFADKLRAWMIDGMNYDEGQITPVAEWHIWEQWGITEARFWQCVAEGVRKKALFWEGEPEPLAYEMLGRLLSMDYQIHIVTARTVPGATLEARSATFYWLENSLKLPWSSVIISNNKAIIRSHALIDDSVINCDTVAQHGILPICYNQPWNQDWGGMRAHDFYDVHDLVLELTEELSRDNPDPRKLHDARTRIEEPTVVGSKTTD